MAVRTPLRTTTSCCAICLLLCCYSFFLLLLRCSLHGLSSQLARWSLSCLVVVEATSTLAPEPASRHHLVQERGSSEPRLFEGLEQHLSNVKCGIESNEVEQREWPHRIARSQHHADVDVLFRGKFLLQQANRVEQIGHEQVIDDKAGPILTHNHALSQTLTDCTGSLERLVRGREGAHEFEELHCRNRNEKVGARQAFRGVCG